MQLFRSLVAGAGLLVAGQSIANATTYPMTITDVANRQVEIAHEPKRIVLQDGRDLFTLALLDRQDLGTLRASNGMRTVMAIASASARLSSDA
ncbi:hypothetical protein [Pseudomonas sp. B14(2022)]|uniref:hypothetical protein n=1 Tax=Pseudomonas sp. B14(2022) TaxID=2914043 RepID=UPI001981521D|nr:hypothetical protein [Pseudomonas sp. B14(2022)]